MMNAKNMTVLIFAAAMSASVWAALPKLGISNEISKLKDSVSEPANTGDWQLREAAFISNAGGLEKYIEMDATPERRIVWKHFSSKNGEPGFNPRLRAAANNIVIPLQKAKGNCEPEEKNLRGARLAGLDEVPELLDKGKATAEERKAFVSEAKRARAAWLAKWDPSYVEPDKKAAASAASAEAASAHAAEVAKAGYYLDKLVDEDRNKRNVEKRKAAFDALVKERFSPDEMLGTYSTSRFWKGLPVFKDPELKNEWASLQEMTYKCYYKKGGACYIVTGGFRQGVKKADVGPGKTSEMEGYFPGCDAPLEIPAELASKAFGK